MQETLRLGDVPGFRDLLVQFAKRIDSSFDVERGALRDVHTILKYKNGERFTYTLDPNNFRVEEHDDLVRRVSPINGSSQARRVEFSIRTEDGMWRGPIGTTCILKDIFGLDLSSQVISELENALLDAAHVGRQQELLDQHGEDFSGYARGNGVPERYLTAAYLAHLRDDDPLQQHLQRLLQERLPLSRLGLRLLRQRVRSDAASGAGWDVSVVAPAAEPAPRSVQSQRPVRPPWVDDGRRACPPELMVMLKPHRAVVLKSLPEALRVEADQVLSDDAPTCSVELLTALRCLTGGTGDDIGRSTSHPVWLDQDVQWLLERWPALIPHLEEQGAVRLALLRDRLSKNALTAAEKSELKAATQKAGLVGFRTDDVAVAAEEDGWNLPLDAHQQRLWNKRFNELAVHFRSGQEDLRERLLTQFLLIRDLPSLGELQRRREQARFSHSQRTALLLRNGIIERLPEDLRMDTYQALEDDNVPDHVRRALDDLARVHQLDPNTFQRITFPKASRAALLAAWPKLMVLIPGLDSMLEAALKRDTYSLEEAAALRKLLNQWLPGEALSEDERRLLRRHEGYWGRALNHETRKRLAHALLHRKYTVDQFCQLLAVMDQVRKYIEQRAEQERSDLLAAATALHTRLSQYWSYTDGRRHKILQRVKALDLATHLPQSCRDFAQNQQRLNVEIRGAVERWLDGLPFAQ